METIQIDILNPKAINILKDLAAANLIRLNKSSTAINFTTILKRLQRNSVDAPSLEDITREVEFVRRTRNE